VTGTHILAVAAIAQAGFLAALIAFLLFRRRRTAVRADQLAPLVAAAQSALKGWVGGEGGIEPFIRSLRELPKGTALELASQLTASVLTPEARGAFASAVRGEPWIQKTLGRATSRVWWHRREAARALALVGRPADRATVERLLNDSQPTVAVLAIAALPRVADGPMIGRALDRYPSLPPVVRRFLIASLQQLSAAVEPELMIRLSADAAPQLLTRWIALAAELRLTAALDRAAGFVSHPDAHVRQAVARALGRRPHPGSLLALHTLSADGDPGVRAAAARAMGQLGNVAALEPLGRAVHDPSWSVRYEACLALGTLGERGRAALGHLRGDPDRYVADMARLISGLGDGALLELVVEP
jgi:HEAT repeat protein